MKTTKTFFGILTIAGALLFPARAQVPPSCITAPSGLIDWWPGNGNALDLAGTNNGIIPDPVDVTFTAGEVGQAFAFSGISPNGNDSGNEVDFGTNVGNFGTNDFTVDFWIEQPPSATGLYGILEKRLTCDGTSNFWSIRDGSEFADPSPAGVLQFEMNGNGPGVDYSILGATIAINDGTFHHAAFVRQGLTSSIYIDGILNASMTNVGIAPLENTDMMRAGQSICVGTDGTQPFVGELDELDLFNRALAPAEIYAIYQAGSAGKCSTPTPPIIVTQPQSQIAMAYSNVLFNTSATGLPSPYYQWSFDGTSIPGATSSALTISDVVQTNLGTYAVVVSNALGVVTSSNAVLSMYPFIEVPFSGLDTLWGYTNTLSVDAWGTGPLTFQWFDNGVAIEDATNDTLTFDGIQVTNAGVYSVVVASPLGSVTNMPQQVVVNPAGVSLGLSPVITISGVAGFNYMIQRTANLADTNSWITVTNLTLIEPTQLWVDTNINTTLPGNPQQFYRVLPGQ